MAEYACARQALQISVKAQLHIPGSGALDRLFYNEQDSRHYGRHWTGKPPLVESLTRYRFSISLSPFGANGPLHIQYINKRP
jgi:hypothetical protein